MPQICIIYQNPKYKPSTHPDHLFFPKLLSKLVCTSLSLTQPPTTPFLPNPFHRASVKLPTPRETSFSVLVSSLSLDCQTLPSLYRAKLAPQCSHSTHHSLGCLCCGSSHAAKPQIWFTYCARFTLSLPNTKDFSPFPLSLYLELVNLLIYPLTRTNLF